MKVMKKNQTYFLKDIIQAVKSEELDDDFCLYAKENEELNFQDSYLPCWYIWQWLWEFEKPISISYATVFKTVSEKRLKIGLKKLINKKL